MSKNLVFTTLVFLAGSTADAKNPKETLRRHGDAFREIEGRFSLHLIDAVTGKPIPNAVVIFEGVKSKSDPSGMVHFEAPFDLADGDDKRFALFKAKGYATSKLPLDFMMGSLWFNRYSISPKLSSDKLRIVIDWKEDPADLDAHLMKENSYHISYRDKRKYQDRAWLDRDDRDGFGPETITINKLDLSAKYHFFVHDYTNRQSQSASGLSNGKAHVRVYDESGLIHTFKAPSDTNGTKWDVFKIVDGEIKATNRIR